MGLRNRTQQPFWRVTPIRSTEPTALYQHGIECVGKRDGKGMISTGWALCQVSGLHQHQASDFLTDGYRIWRDSPSFDRPQAAAFLSDLFGALSSLTPPAVPADIWSASPEAVMPASIYYGTRCWAGNELLEVATDPQTKAQYEPLVFRSAAEAPHDFVPTRSVEFAKAYAAEHGLAEPWVIVLPGQREVVPAGSPSPGRGAGAAPTEVSNFAGSQSGPAAPNFAPPGQAPTPGPSSPGWGGDDPAARERQQRERQEQQRAEQQRAEQERAQREQWERQQAEQQRAEQQRAEQQRAEQERAQREQWERQQAEQQRIQQEQAERAERERQERERAEQERQRAEQERLQREQLQREQWERQQAEQQRIQQEQAERAERERQERERAEQERLQREQWERQQAEQQRIQREQAERAERERQERERAEQERQRAERERLQREQWERERAERELAEQQRAEQQRAERERARTAERPRPRPRPTPGTARPAPTSSPAPVPGPAAAVPQPTQQPSWVAPGANGSGLDIGQQTVEFLRPQPQPQAQPQPDASVPPRLQDLRSCVLSWLNDGYRDVRLESNGWITIPDIGPSVIQVETSMVQGGHLKAEVFAPLVLDVPLTTELYRYVALEGGRFHFGAISLDAGEDGNEPTGLLQFSHSVLADTLEHDELLAVVWLVAATIMTRAEELKQRFGGLLYAELEH